MADLIGPVMKRSDATVVHRYQYWEEKKDMAFFRYATFALFMGGLLISSGGTRLSLVCK